MPDPVPALPGTRRLFLHCVASPAPVCDRQAERALLLASGDDVVCVPRQVDPEYLGFLSSLGLGPTAANIVTVPARDGVGSSIAERLLRTGGGVEQLAGRLGSAEVVVDPRAATPDVFALARALELVRGHPVRVDGGPAELTALADAKDRMRERAVELGIPVAPGELAELPSPFGRRRRDLEPLRAAIERQRRCTGSVVVRGALGTGGSSRFVVEPGGDDTDDVLRRIALRSDNRVYLVEVLADATVRTTVHLRLDPETGRVCLLGVSDRRLGRGLMPVGSRYPTMSRTREAMEEWASRLAASLAAEGFAGSLAVDFVEHRDATGRPGAFFSGLCPRVGEATYALALGRRLSAPALVSGTVPTRAGTFGRLRELLGRMLYDADRGCGVVPYASGWLDQGGCPMVALGADRLHASELFGRAQALMAARAVDSPAGRPVS